MVLELFKCHIESRQDIENNEEIIKHIKNGNFRIIESPQHAIARSLSVSKDAVKLISDLDYYLLRNHTDYPFIFSDSPVVFYNTYYYNVKNRGVLGAQTLGLQIFYPLNSDTLLMLVDNQVYEGWYKENLFVDLIENLMYPNSMPFNCTTAIMPFILPAWTMQNI